MNYHVEVLEGHAFVEKYLPQDREVFKTNAQSSLCNRLPLFSFVLFGGEIFFSIHVGEELVATACCMRDLAPGVFTLSYVTVDERHRNKGLATALVESVVEHALARGFKVLDVSSFTLEGEMYLKPSIRRLAGVIKLREQGVPYRH